MSISIIQARLDTYHVESEQEAELALKEITQEVILSALAQAGFFKKAAFQGGTCLRILFGLNRFSEDLDFCLLQPDRAFQLGHFVDAIGLYMKAYGYNFDVQDKSKADSAVQKLFLKETSIGLLLNIQPKQLAIPYRPIRIKLEIDTNPPDGSGYSTQHVDFPSPFVVMAQDKPSLFAGKTHALLSRNYAKGRDWYDFLWYVGQKIVPNYTLLENVLRKSRGERAPLELAGEQYLHMMSEKIQETDFNAVRSDVARFIKPNEQHSLDLWCTDYFMSYLDRLAPLLLSRSS